MAKISTTIFGKFSFHDEKHEVFCWRQCWWMQPCVFFIPLNRCQLLHLYFVLTIFFETGKHAKSKTWYFGMIVVSEDVFRLDLLFSLKYSCSIRKNCNTTYYECGDLGRLIQINNSVIFFINIKCKVFNNMDKDI